MPSWNGLPTELRKEIVERLDFRTRFRFRHVSKTDQELVDSMPLHIPRVVFDVKSKQVVKLTFYLAIEKHIDVGFVNIGGAETSVKVTEVSLANTVQHGAIRRVDYPDALMLALSAFKHVAMSPNTVLGAVELNNTQHVRLKNGPAFFGDRMMRAKIVCLTNDSTGHLVTRIVPSEVEEFRVMSRDPTDPKNSVQMMTHTRRLRVRADKEALDKLTDPLDRGWEQLYIIATDEEREADPLDKIGNVPGVRVQMIGDDDFLSKAEAAGVFFCKRNNPCGITFWMSKFEMEREDPTACWMRWACPVHADPFDHWYTTKIPRGTKDTQFTFAIDPMSEYIFPVLNGDDSEIDRMLNIETDFLTKEKSCYMCPK